jgi:hypothetical protein
MHRHQDFCARCDGGFDFAWVEVVSALVNIDKNRLRAGADNGFNGSDEGVRGRDYFVTRSHAQSQQSQVQGRSAGSDADCALRANGRGECLLEVRHFRAENETRVVDNTFDGRVDFGFVGSVLGFEID